MRVLLIGLFFLYLLSQEAIPQIKADVDPVEPNQVTIIRVTVTNPGTADMLWGNVLKIETLPPTFIPVRDEYTLSHEIRPGKTDIGELSFQVSRETEGGTYPVSISLSGGVGPCEEGCVPYFIEKEISVTVVRNEPDIRISHTVQGDTMVITLKNVGSGKAQSIICGETPVGTLTPGKETEVTMQKTSHFTMTYEDQFGKKFSESFRITEETPEPEKDTSIQSILIFCSIFIGYLFKRFMN